MSVAPRYEKCACTALAGSVRAQSVVECRLGDWSENTVLAVRPAVVFGAAECLSGEVRYGGKLFFTVLARAQDGALVSAERGAEFSHRAVCAEAAPAHTPDVRLFVEKMDVKRDGRAVVLSAIVTAEICLYAPSQIEYLAGGEGVCCDFRPSRVTNIVLCGGTAEIEEEFDTDYVCDVLLHSEEVSLTRVFAADGCLDVSGEINLGVVAKREGESDAVSYERLIPFRAEIPCEGASSGMACDARVCVEEAKLTASCDEEKGRCRILAVIGLQVRGRLYAEEEVLLPQDAFCPGYAGTPAFSSFSSEVPVCAFTSTERLSGVAASDKRPDFSCSLQASALPRAEVAATVSDGEITAEGVLDAAVFFKNGQGEADCAHVSLPFSFPVRSDRARKGMRADVVAIACGVTVRQKKEGELETEGALKLFFTLREPREARYVCRMEAGEEKPVRDVAISVFVPAAGDTLWAAAKKLDRPPEKVQEENPSLSFPLTGGERIVLYRKKEIS